MAHSPVLAAQRQGIEEVRAGLVVARTYPHNPEISLEVADRRGPDFSGTDRGVSVTQEIEIAGQRGKRVAVASAQIAAAEANFSRQRCLLAHQVEMAFAEAIRSRELLEVAEADAELAGNLLDFSSRRLEQGAGTQIEVNVAQASAGRAGRRVAQARAADLAARSHLAEVVGLPAATLPEPVGELPASQAAAPPLSELLAAAWEQRADFEAANLLAEVAEAEIVLARAEGRPRLTVGAFAEREERTDELVGATVGISLPLFDRQQGRVARHQAERERLSYEVEAVRRTIEREVTTALARLEAARAAAEQLQDQVVATLDDNVDLLQRSFAAGRVGFTDVVTLRREFIAGRSEYVETLADAWLARLELAMATGCGDTGRREETP